MHNVAFYYRGAAFIAEGGLSSAAILAVPVLGGALMYLQRRRNARPDDRD
jgi:hypothetical protein